MTSNYQTAVERSNELLHYLEEMERQYESTQATKQEPDFFQTVKPFADKVHEVLQEWESVTKDWIQKEFPKYIHVQQIDSTVENIQLVSVQCFYPDTREKRFKGMIQSIRYVLSDIVMKHKENA